jgi:hypothetical protein
MLDAVPFLDLAAVNGALHGEYELAWKAVLEHGRFVGAPEVEEFEARFAAYCDITACIGVANGTDAVECFPRCCAVTVPDDDGGPGTTCECRCHWITPGYRKMCRPHRLAMVFTSAIA